MRLAILTRSLLLIPVIVTALLVAAPAAQADCEFQGDVKAGSIDCISWAGNESPGTAEQSNDTSSSQTNVSDNSSQDSVSAPTCRDSGGDVVPCTTENENGDQCYFGSPIGPAPDGSGGGVVYVCPSVDDDPAADPPSATSPDAEPADPVVVAWQAVASMDLQAVEIQIAPEPLSVDAAAMGLVGLPVWMWADSTAATWGPITASASDGPVSVAASARVERVEWDMGDETVVTCSTHGTPFDPDVHRVDDRSPDCGHVYERTSRNQPDGVYTVTATSYWVAEWSDDAGESGTIPFELTTSEQIRIGEMQVLRTDSTDPS